MPPKGTATAEACEENIPCRQIGVICAAKGHCDVLVVRSEVKLNHRSDMCRQRALRPLRLPMRPEPSR